MRFIHLHALPFLLFLIVFFTPLSISAQNSLPEFSTRPNWDFGLTGGVAAYQGDVADFLQTADFQYFGGVTARIQWSPFLFGRINASYGKIQGKDINYNDQSWRTQRAFSFSSPVGELSAIVELSPFGDLKNIGNGLYRPRRLVPYVFIGAGAAYIKPTTDFNIVRDNNPVAALDKIRADQSQAATNYRIVMPVGGGIRLNLSAKTMIGIEVGLRPTFDDYLDGISEAGNPKKKDWYALSGITLSQRFGNASK
jgi:OmpA-OmpF porin, OOP family